MVAQRESNTGKSIETSCAGACQGTIKGVSERSPQQHQRKTNMSRSPIRHKRGGQILEAPLRGKRKGTIVKAKATSPKPTSYQNSEQESHEDRHNKGRLSTAPIHEQDPNTATGGHEWQKRTKCPVAEDESKRKHTAEAYRGDPRRRNQRSTSFSSWQGAGNTRKGTETREEQEPDTKAQGKKEAGEQSPPKGTR